MSKNKKQSPEDAARLAEEAAAAEAAAAEEEAAEAEAEPTEEATEEATAASAPDPAEALQAEQDKYLRLYADFDNFRKRTAKEKAETYAIATAAAIEALLPAIDSFGLGLNVPCADAAYKQGMEKIYTQLSEALKKLGITEIEAMGAPFDPNFHNAIKQVEDENFGESTVCEVYQKGYMLGSRVIRHAMVAVAN